MPNKPPIDQDDLVRAVHERVIDIWMRLFQDSIEEFQTGHPNIPPVPEEVLARFRQDYQIAVEKFNQMHIETRGDFTMKQMRKSLPGNLWIAWETKILTDLARHILQTSKPRKPDRSLHREALRRKQKKDVM